MSQESDAVVLVVSEETGDISIAERGQLIRKLSPDALRGLLFELLGRPEGAPGHGFPVLTGRETTPAATSTLQLDCFS